MPPQFVYNFTTTTADEHHKWFDQYINQTRDLLIMRIKMLLIITHAQLNGHLCQKK